MRNDSALQGQSCQLAKKKWEAKEANSNFLQYLFLWLFWYSDFIITLVFTTCFSLEYFISALIFFLRYFKVKKPSPITSLIYKSKRGHTLVQDQVLPKKQDGNSKYL